MIIVIGARTFIYWLSHCYICIFIYSW